MLNAMIFAAGRGNRMKPLTNETPKPLVSINHNQTILDELLHWCNHQKLIDKIIVNAAYKAEAIKSHITKYHDGDISKPISLSIEPDPDIYGQLETGGAVKFARKYLEYNNRKASIDEPILLINGDIYISDSKNYLLPSMRNYWQKLAQYNPKLTALLLLIPIEYALTHGIDNHKGDFYAKQHDIDGVMELSMIKKIPTDILAQNSHQHSYNAQQKYIFSGIQLINPQIIYNHLQDKFSISEIYQASCNINGDMNNIYGISMEHCQLAKWWHIGDIASLQKIRADLT